MMLRTARKGSPADEESIATSRRLRPAVARRASGPSGEDAGAAVEAATPAVADYEKRLKSDSRWALSEGSRHFEENSAVFSALHKIARRLDELKIPYAVVGGMALFKHGYRRFTEDVDILVSKEGLKRLHRELEGLGLSPAP